MRTILLLIGLYLVHRVLLYASQAYATHMRRMDRQLTWVSLILVVYLLISASVRLLSYIRQP
jgi:hypothetical protein